jgi:hypothetical protein
LRDFHKTIGSRDKLVADIEGAKPPKASCILANLSLKQGPHIRLGRLEAAIGYDVADEIERAK